MKTHPHTKIVAVISAFALASCASPPAPVRMQVSAALRPDGSITDRLYQEVNSHRRSIGKRELQRHSGLDRLAQDHSDYLRKHRGEFSLHGKYVSHAGFQGRTEIARERYQMENISENVAATSKVAGSTTQRLVNLWKSSKEHNKNMNDDWTHTGIGVAVDADGMVFATQIFTTVSMSQMSARERFNRF